MKQKIEWVCLTNSTGYAQSARDYIFALKDEYDLRILSLDNNPDQDVLCRSSLETINLLRHKPFDKEAIQVFQCIPDMQRRKQWVKEKCKKIIGFATFEADNPPEHWINIFNKNDAVIVPSEYCKELFINHGVKAPIYKIPHVVNTNLYKPNVEKSMPDDRFTFLYIATFRERKNYAELIKAWKSFYSESPNHRLLLKTDSGDQLRHLIIKTCHGRMPENVYIIDHVINEKEMPMLIASADCLVHPSLGEGFGLPPLFAMAMKVPVAVPRHTGMLEYATENNCTLINTNGLFTPETTMDNYPQFRKCKWFEVDYLKIYQAMYKIDRNRKEALEKAEIAYQDVLAKFTYENARNLFEKMILEM